MYDVKRQGSSKLFGLEWVACTRSKGDALYLMLFGGKEPKETKPSANAIVVEFSGSMKTKSCECGNWERSSVPKFRNSTLSNGLFHVAITIRALLSGLCIMTRYRFYPFLAMLLLSEHRPFMVLKTEMIKKFKKKKKFWFLIFIHS